MLSRWTQEYKPMHDMQSLLRRMDQLFGDFNSARLQWPDTRLEGDGPAVNVYDDGSQFVVEALVPGIRLDDIELDVTPTTLSLRAHREPKIVEGATVHRREREPLQFTNTLQLPAEVDAERVSAKLEHGVLTVELAKHESAQPRKISVRAT